MGPTTLETTDCTQAGPSDLSSPRYALAEINSILCLVECTCIRRTPSFSDSQVPPASANAPSDARVYTHEFAGIFRFSYITAFKSGELAVLERVDPRSTMPDDEQAVIFVARDVMARVAQKTMPAQLQRRISLRSSPMRPRRVIRG
jgi:hypothetical protein